MRSSIGAVLETFRGEGRDLRLGARCGRGIRIRNFDPMRGAEEECARRNFDPMRSAEEEGGRRNFDPMRSAEEETESGFLFRTAHRGEVPNPDSSSAPRRLSPLASQ